MASKENKWAERLFGNKLINCATIKDNNGCYELINTLDCFAQCNITIIYFSFANINAQNDDTTKHLLMLYQTLNNNTAGITDCNNSDGNCAKLNNENKKQHFVHVVQIVLWANNDVFGDFEKSHRDCIAEMPWYSVPFSEIELKTRLSRRYRIKVGVPTLVLLDADGITITVSGKERLVEDPLGNSFPWRPRPVEQVLNDVTLIAGNLYESEHSGGLKSDIRYQDLPPVTIRGFYFSAHWCPPCRAFTPQLIETYKFVRKRDPGFEVIFVSSDRSADSFDSYVAIMPWLVIPYQQSQVRAELAQLYGVRGIPTLLLVDGNGHVVTHDARTEIQDDPKGQNYPWKPRPVNILTERYATKLHDYPAIVLFIEGGEVDIEFADSVLRPPADNYYKKYSINFNTPQEEFLYSNNENEHYIQFLIGLDSETSDLVRDLIGLEDIVPLLVAVDIPNNRLAIMDEGNEITIESVCQFVDKFQKNELEFKNINEHNVTESKSNH